MKGKIIVLVQKIPYGHVTSYGKIAELLDTIYDIKTSGWMVGRMLSSLPESEWMSCPWRRVINKQGYISALKLGTKGLIQKQLLEKEGIEIIHDTVNMKKYGWSG